MVAPVGPRFLLHSLSPLSSPPFFFFSLFLKIFRTRALFFKIKACPLSFSEHFPPLSHSLPLISLFSLFAPTPKISPRSPASSSADDGVTINSDDFKVIGFSNFVQFNPRCNCFPFRRFQHYEFWCIDTTNVRQVRPLHRQSHPRFLPSSLRMRAARVISINGELHEYNIPIRVSQVLESESFSSSSSSGFVCNSDSLYYEEFVPALANEDELVPNQIYFVLPKSKLQHRLTVSDMAALTVKASVAMQKASKGGAVRRCRRKTQISPVLVVNQRPVSDYSEINELKVKRYGNRPEKAASASATALSRSGSVRKLQRQSSRRLKKAVRSFRIRLSTIEEGTAVSD